MNRNFLQYYVISNDVEFVYFKFNNFFLSHLFIKPRGGDSRMISILKIKSLRFSIFFRFYSPERVIIIILSYIYIYDFNNIILRSILLLYNHWVLDERVLQRYVVNFFNCHYPCT